MGANVGQVYVVGTSTPTINHEKCTNCGDCLKFCPSGTFRFCGDKGKPMVECSNGCNSTCRICARICPNGAITFLDEEEFICYLNLRLAKVRKALEDIGNYFEPPITSHAGRGKRASHR